MRATLITVIAFVAMAMPAMAEQKKVTITGYMPPPQCWQKPRGTIIHVCPDPWVELDQKEPDPHRDTVWYCIDRQMSCYENIKGGCGCQGGPLLGWELQQQATIAIQSQDDLRAEIRREVIDPCLNSLVHGRGGVMGLSEDEAVQLGR